MLFLKATLCLYCINCLKFIVLLLPILSANGERILHISAGEESTSTAAISEEYDTETINKNENKTAKKQWTYFLNYDSLVLDADATVLDSLLYIRYNVFLRRPHRLNQENSNLEAECSSKLSKVFHFCNNFALELTICMLAFASIEYLIYVWVVLRYLIWSLVYCCLWILWKNIYVLYKKFIGQTILDGEGKILVSSGCGQSVEESYCSHSQCKLQQMLLYKDNYYYLDCRVSRLALCKLIRANTCESNNVPFATRVIFVRAYNHYIYYAFSSMQHCSKYCGEIYERNYYQRAMQSDYLNAAEQKTRHKEEDQNAQHHQPCQPFYKQQQIHAHLYQQQQYLETDANAKRSSCSACSCYDISCCYYCCCFRWCYCYCYCCCFCCRFCCYCYCCCYIYYNYQYICSTRHSRCNYCHCCYCPYQYCNYINSNANAKKTANFHKQLEKQNQQQQKQQQQQAQSCLYYWNQSINADTLKCNLECCRANEYNSFLHKQLSYDLISRASIMIQSLFLTFWNCFSTSVYHKGQKRHFFYIIQIRDVNILKLCGSTVLCFVYYNINKNLSKTFLICCKYNHKRRRRRRRYRGRRRRRRRKVKKISNYQWLHVAFQLLTCARQNKIMKFYIKKETQYNKKLNNVKHFLLFNAFKTIKEKISRRTASEAIKRIRIINSYNRKRVNINLAWLFIGLIWFKAPKLTHSSSATSEVSLNCSQDGKNCTHKVYANNIPPSNQAVFPEPYLWLNIKYSKRQESKTQTDTDRLESIKKQILSKLGLTQKPKVFNKLPKQYIWDTLYRADGVNTVSELNGFTPHTRTVARLLQDDNSVNHQSINEQYYPNNKISNYNRNYDTYVTNGAVSNSNYLTLFHLKNNTKIFTNYMQKEQYIKSILKKEQLKDYHTVNKNTYLSSNNYINSSSRSTKDVYQNTPEHIFFENEDFFGTTQEVITFAEAGSKYKKHRLIEFSAQTKNVPSQKSFVRNAMIHIRIGKHAGNVAKYVINQKHKLRKSQSNAKLKVWIFQVITSNLTLKGFDEFARLRASFNVDTKRLGWQKFDLTQTVNDWYANNVSEKLKLLIDCTGCGREYELYLFDEVNAPDNPQRTEQKQKQAEQQQSETHQNFRYKKMNIFFHNKHKQKMQNKHFHDGNKPDDSSKEDFINKNLKNGAEIKQYVNNLDYSLPPTIGVTKQNNDNCLEMNHCKYKNLNLFSGQGSLLSLPTLPQLNINNTEMGASLKLQQELNPNRPFLVLRTETKRLRRVRRRAVDCSGALHGQCCKESFYVSFKALGWDDWIIAPRGYFANYCRGDCTGPFRTPDTFQTFHAHFIEEYRKMGLLNGMKPCCAPVKFSSMSLIYYGDDGIIKRDLPKMVIDECGCP